MRTLSLLAPLLLLAAVPPAHAQRVRLTGTIVDSLTGSPLVGITVSLIDENRTAVTDSSGRFGFPDLGDGLYTVAVRHLGYEPMAIRFRLTVQRRRQVELGTFRLAPAATELDPIVVEAELVAEIPQMRGFYQRMRSEQGTFLTRADIEREAPQLTSDLIRKIPGFRADESGRIISNRGIPSMRNSFSACLVQYFIDGVASSAPTIDVVQPHAIIGMEIYTGSSTIPPLYRKGNPHCGVIAIWTRHGRRP